MFTFSFFAYLVLYGIWPIGILVLFRKLRAANKLAHDLRRSRDNWQFVSSIDEALLQYTHKLSAYGAFIRSLGDSKQSIQTSNPHIDAAEKVLLEEIERLRTLPSAPSRARTLEIEFRRYSNEKFWESDLRPVVESWHKVLRAIRAVQSPD